MFLYLTIALLFSIDIYRSLFPHEFNLLVNIFYRYKNETTEFFKPKMISLSYNVIYVYSYLQIKYSKITIPLIITIFKNASKIIIFLVINYFM